MNYRTKKCIVCGERARVYFYCGHVLENRKKITAGWCYVHSEIPEKKPCPNLLNSKGCYGGYHARYGKKEDK